MNAAARTAVAAAKVALAGVVLSGPVGMGLAAIHPQPPWRDAETAARAYHPIQTASYFLGFLLVGGSLAFVAALHALAREELRARATAGLAFASAFAGLIFLNYVAQTTFVPVLVRDFRPENGPFVAALSLANPRSLGWAIEMWGYALLGVATWLVAPVMSGRGRLGDATAALLVANGPISIAGGLWTAFDPGWVMTRAGLGLFAAWNVLMFVMLALAIVALRGHDSTRVSRLVEAP